MDYKKKYENALEWARKVINGECGFIRKDVEEVFPELKENEDERIRKELIAFLKENHETGRADETWSLTGIERWIAWLEKQGQSKKTSIWKHWKDGIAGNGDGIPVFLIKNGSTYSLSSCLGFECDYIELSELDKLMLEKQGERPTPIDIDKMVYKYGNTKEDCTNGLPVNCQIRAYRQGINDTLNLVFNLEKQGEQNHTDKVKPKFKVKYANCEYNVLEIKEIAGITYFGIEDEPNHIDYVLPDNCEIVSGYGYGVKEKGSPYPTKSAIFSEQNLAWSEEDDEQVSIITNIIQAHCGKLIDCRANLKWLKSLKERLS